MHLVLDKPLPSLDEESKRLQAKKERGYDLTDSENEFVLRVGEMDEEKFVRAAAEADPGAEYARIRAKIASGAILNKAEMKYLRETLDQIRTQVLDSGLAWMVASDKEWAKGQKKTRGRGAANHPKPKGDDDNDGDDDDDDTDSESGESAYNAVLTDEQLAEFHQLQEVHDWFGREEAEAENETVANHPIVADVVMHSAAEEVTIAATETAADVGELLAADVEPAPVVGPAHPHLPPNSRFRFAEGAPGIENYVEDYLQQIQEEYNPIDTLIRKGLLVHSEVMALDIENRPEAVEDPQQQEAAEPYQRAESILEAPDNADFKHNLFVHDTAFHPYYISEAPEAASVVHNHPNPFHQGQNLQFDRVQYNQELGYSQVPAIIRERTRTFSVTPSERMWLNHHLVPQSSAPASTIHFWLLCRSDEYPMMLSLRSQLRVSNLFFYILYCSFTLVLHQLHVLSPFCTSIANKHTGDGALQRVSSPHSLFYRVRKPICRRSAHHRVT
jgi:hypothetical protein